MFFLTILFCRCRYVFWKDKIFQGIVLLLSFDCSGKACVLSGSFALCRCRFETYYDFSLGQRDRRECSKQAVFFKSWTRVWLRKHSCHAVSWLALNTNVVERVVRYHHFNLVSQKASFGQWGDTTRGALGTCAVVFSSELSVKDHLCELAAIEGPLHPRTQGFRTRFCFMRPSKLDFLWELWFGVATVENTIERS